MRDEVLRQIANALLHTLRAAATVALLCACSPPAPLPPPTILISSGSKTPPSSDTPLPSPPPKAAASTPIPWESDESTARERLRRRGGLLVVYVRADWSAASLEMERRIWSNPKVQKAMEGTIALMLDVSDPDRGELYVARYDLHAVPSTFVIDANGQKLASIAGFADMEALLAALNQE